MSRLTEETSEHFYYVVVGEGSVGCAVANRLSESSHYLSTLTENWPMGMRLISWTGFS